MGRKAAPLKPGEGVHLSIRLDADVAHSIDALVKSLSTSTRLPVTRTDVVRLLLSEALDARAEAAKPKK